MLDKQTASFLKVITKLCGDGGYKVIEIEDLLDALPTRFAFDQASINNCIDYLHERSFIDVKYKEGDIYCLATLPKARLYFENEVEQYKVTRNFRKLFIASMVCSGLASFLGAMIAILIFR